MWVESWTCTLEVLYRVEMVRWGLHRQRRSCAIVFLWLCVRFCYSSILLPCAGEEMELQYPKCTAVLVGAEGVALCAQQDYRSLTLRSLKAKYYFTDSLSPSLSISRT